MCRMGATRVPQGGGDGSDDESRVCGRDQLTLVAALRIMVLIPLGEKGVAFSPGKVLGPGLAGRPLLSTRVHLDVLVRNEIVSIITARTLVHHVRSSCIIQSRQILV